MNNDGLTPLQEKTIRKELMLAFKKGKVHGEIKIGFKNIEEIDVESDFSWGDNETEHVVSERYKPENNRIISDYINSRKDFLKDGESDKFTLKHFEKELREAYLSGQQVGINIVYGDWDEEYLENEERYASNVIIRLKY
jgi:hypothetical protein